MEDTKLVGNTLRSMFRATLDYCIEWGVKIRNQRAEVVFVGCFSHVILEKYKTHHFITCIEHNKDVMISAADDVIHDFDCYGDVGVGRWWYRNLRCTGKWCIFNARFAPGELIIDALLQGLGKLSITVHAMEEVVHGR